MRRVPIGLANTERGLVVNDKVKTLIVSRRFWLAVSGVVFVAVQSVFPDIDQDTVNNVVVIVGSWIVGDSLRETKPNG